MYAYYLFVCTKRTYIACININIESPQLYYIVLTNSEGIANSRFIFIHILASPQDSKSGVVERLVKRIIKYDPSKLLDRSKSKMNNILKELFVIRSLSMGILGDSSKLNIAGDGTCMPTHASPNGKKV